MKDIASYTEDLANAQHARDNAADSLETAKNAVAGFQSDFDASIDAVTAAEAALDEAVARAKRGEWTTPAEAEDTRTVEDILNDDTPFAGMSSANGEHVETV